MIKYLILFCAVLFISCNKKEIDLFQIEKDKIERKWKIELELETFISGSLSSSNSDIFLADFKDDETVILTSPDQGGVEQISNWYYQLRPEKIIIVNNTSPFAQSLIPNDYFSVLEKSDTRQVWQYETGSGINTTVKTWTLTVLD
jgi:hypothetical protein